MRADERRKRRAKIKRVRRGDEKDELDREIDVIESKTRNKLGDNPRTRKNERK